MKNAKERSDQKPAQTLDRCPVRFVEPGTPSFPGELLRGNINYCDKVFQWTLLPRIVLIFCTFFFTIIFTIVHPHMSIKWWILSFSLFLALFTAIPKRMLNKRLLQGILQLPSLLAGIVSNLFKLKGVNKQFIHTEHDH